MFIRAVPAKLVLRDMPVRRSARSCRWSGTSNLHHQMCRLAAHLGANLALKATILTASRMPPQITIAMM